MPNETVEQEVTQEGAEQVSGQDGLESSQGSEGAGASSSVDPAMYEKLQSDYSQLSTNWSKIEQLANADPVFRKELERAWRGLPPQQATPQQAKQESKPKQAPQSMKEIEELKQSLKQIQDTFQSQRQEALRKEKFVEVQTETEQIAKRFNASEADMNEFWKRYGEMIRTEAMSAMQNNPGLPPNVATQMAYSRHDRNLAAEYINLMEDRMYDYFGNKIRERSNPMKGITSPADKAAKSGGATPTMQERFLSTLKKERNPEKRAEMIKAYSEEMGMPVESFFRSSGG